MTAKTITHDLDFVVDPLSVPLFVKSCEAVRAINELFEAYKNETERGGPAAIALTALAVSLQTSDYLVSLTVLAEHGLAVLNDEPQVVNA